MPAKVTVPKLLARKGKQPPITCVTAYDFPSARLVDEAGFDVLLVGDSMANVVLGHASTLKITLEQIISATRAVRRAADRPLVVADMPYGSFHLGPHDTVRNAIRLVREGGAHAVKLEGGANRAHLVAALADADVAVMGHVGLLPQAVHVRGGFRVAGRTREGAERLLADALALEEAGAFAVVLEGVPAPVAAGITRRLRIPTIGIGAGPHCDGQILVFHDVVGLNFGPVPRFAKRFGAVADEMRRALAAFRDEVRSGTFPGEEHGYSMGESLAEGWEAEAPQPWAEPGDEA